jgi:tRNA dimethylallyltransferase
MKFDYSQYNNDELYQRLLEIDHNTLIHKNNRKRIERALNYYEVNKKLMSDKESSDKLLYDAIFIGLTTDRDKLYTIINNRFDKMLESGLLDEVKAIYESNIRTKSYYDTNWL